MSRQVEAAMQHQPLPPPPPPQYHPSSNRSLLEQKLELLEARFTQPLESLRSPFTGNSSTTTINPFTSPFGVNPNNNNNSQHSTSFTFDTPSLSATAFPHSNSVGVSTNVTDNKKTSDNHNIKQGAPFASGVAAAAAATVASSLGVGGGLQAVEQATARHLQRLVAQSNNNNNNSSSSIHHHHHHRHHDNDNTRSSQAIVVAASDTSQNNHNIFSNNSSSSRSTLVAGNKTSGRSTGGTTGNKTRQTRLSPIILKEHDAVSNSKKSSKNMKKRKSVPAKIHIPSVKENLAGDHNPNGSNINNNNNNNNKEGQQRKRTRSSSTSDEAATPSMLLPQSLDATSAPVAAPTATTTTAVAATTDSNGSSSNSRASKSAGVAASKSKQTRQRGSKSSAGVAASKGSETTTAPSTASRDANESKKAGKKPAQNALISAYFLSTSSSRKKTSTSTVTATTTTTSATSAAAAAAATAPTSTSKRKAANTSSSKTTSPTPRRPQPKKNENQSQAKLLEELQRRVKELEDIAQDKDQQLKAVANNRTILHTALKTALNQREKELDDLAKAKSDWEARARLSMETLVRSEAEQDAKDLQERITADEARLGRIIQSRSSSSSSGRRPGGMMINGGYVETWEEGYASRNLQTKRLELQERKVAHETRLAQAQTVAEQWKTATDDQGNQSDPTGKDEAIVVGGVPIRSLLDIREQLESCRYHLQNISREEKELAAEEQKLHEEKGAHIRLLKRVASEEASRFRSRPKLHDRYVLKRLLGKGGFSEVWRAFDLVDLCEVAVKIHQLDPRWSESKKENYTKHVSREYEIHRSVRHPRIVSLLDVFEIDNHSFATVLECCDGTDLDTLLKKKRRLVERDARAVLLQILSGMQYLSQPSADGSRQGIIHYDLKPGNILFDTLGDAKITDFGLSKIVDAVDAGDSMELTSQGAGTYWYLPPECFMMEENPRISNKVDVWSIGVIFYQMLFGKRPFGDGQSQDKILSDRTILNAHEVLFPDSPTISDDCEEFIKTCLSYDQAFRPTIAQLCQHPFVLSKEM